MADLLADVIAALILWALAVVAAVVLTMGVFFIGSLF